MIALTAQTGERAAKAAIMSIKPNGRWPARFRFTFGCSKWIAEDGCIELSKSAAAEYRAALRKI